MKKLLCATILLLPFAAKAQMKIGNNPATIDPASLLELENPNKALWLTRVGLNSTSDVTTVPNPKAGMVVYNTNNTLSSANPAYGANGSGIYYFDGTGWVYTGNGSPGLNSWSLLGNSNAADGVNFLGTTNNVAMNFRVNNLRSGRIDMQGNTSFGYLAGSTQTVGLNLNNTLIGSGAGSGISNGSNNTALGFEALQNTGNGFSNVGVGNRAGATFAGQNHNTFIGDSTDITASNITNATAIGAGVKVSQSNSVVLGNNASVGIGNSAPTNKLHVTAAADPLRIEGVQTGTTTGLSGTDMVLTTDANGVVKRVGVNTVLAPINARNGLTRVADSIQLGGQLKQNTQIDVAGNTLDLFGTGAASKVTITTDGGATVTGAGGLNVTNTATAGNLTTGGKTTTGTIKVTALPTGSTASEIVVRNPSTNELETRTVTSLNNNVIGVATNSSLQGDGTTGNLLRINLGNSNTYTADQLLPTGSATQGANLISAVNQSTTNTINAARIGNGLTDAQVSDNLTVTNSTLTGNTITTGSINNTPIGAATANTGRFTTITGTAFPTNTSTSGDIVVAGAGGTLETRTISSLNNGVTVNTDGTTILGNGTTSAIRLNTANPNTFTATQTLPTTDPQGAALIGSVNSATAATINAARIGNGLTDAQVSDNLTVTNSTLTGNTITTGSINNTPIGAATANTGRFTTITGTAFPTNTSTSGDIVVAGAGGTLETRTISSLNNGVTVNTDGTTILGNGTTSAIRLNTANPNTFTATQTLPTTDPQGAALIGSVNSATAATINAARIGNGLTDAQVSDNLTVTNSTLTGNTITTGSINNTPIGAATANTGRFTTITGTAFPTNTSTSNNIVVAGAGGTLETRAVSSLNNNVAVNTDGTTILGNGLAGAGNEIRLNTANPNTFTADQLLPTGSATQGANLISAVNQSTTNTVNAARIGNGLTDAQVSDNLTVTNSTLTGNTITTGSINNTPIGAATANTGRFTTITGTAFPTNTSTSNNIVVAGAGGTLETRAVSSLNNNVAVNTDGTTILGNGLAGAGNEIRLNTANPNTFTATQTLPTTDAQGSALISSVNSSTAGLVNAARIGNGLTDAQVNPDLTIVGGSVNNSPIGATTASTGRFTTLSSTGATDLNITGAAATTIGNSGATTNLNSATINAPAVPASTDPVTATGTNIIIKGATGGRLETITPQALVSAGVQANNGVSVGGSTNLPANAGKVTLGGALNEPTIITTDPANKLYIAGSGGLVVNSSINTQTLTATGNINGNADMIVLGNAKAGSFSTTGITETGTLKVNFTTGGAATDKVLNVDGSGNVHSVTPAALVSAGIQADNGVKVGGTNPLNAGKVTLGGLLNEPTIITAGPTNTLTIAGLQSGSGGDGIVTNSGGVLRNLASLTDAQVNPDLTIVGGSVNSSPIGQAAGGAAAGKFTALEATTTTTLNGNNTTTGGVTVSGLQQNNAAADIVVSDGGVLKTKTVASLNNNVTVATNPSLVGDGTTANKLGINLANSNTYTADQLLPTGSATQGANLISAVNQSTTNTVNAARIGNGLTDAQVNPDLTIVGGSVNSSPIGQAVGGAAAGKFTALEATTTTTLNGNNTVAGGGGVTVSGLQQNNAAADIVVSDGGVLKTKTVASLNNNVTVNTDGTTILGNGTTSAIRLNLNNPNTFTATQTLPTTDAQGSALISSVNSSTAGLVNAARIGNGLTDAQVNPDLTIVGGSVNSSPIGQAVGGAAAGKFTALEATTTTTLNGNNTTTGGVTVSGLQQNNAAADIVVSDGGVLKTKTVASLNNNVTVATNPSLVGDGTTANKLGINLANSNTYTADQLLPTGSATQGANLISAVNQSTTNTVNAARIGNGLTDAQVSDNLTVTNSTLTGNTITTGSVNNTPIGATTASTGRFTDLTATKTTTLNGDNTVAGAGGVTVSGLQQNNAAADIVVSDGGVLKTKTVASLNNNVTVATNPSLVGDGTTANKLGINLSNSNTYLADQLLPTGSATQGANLISAVNQSTTNTVNAARIGNGLTDAQVSDNLTVTNSTLTGNTITTGSVNNTPIGATTASTGRFTDLTATKTTTLNGDNTVAGAGGVTVSGLQQNNAAADIVVSDGGVLKTKTVASLNNNVTVNTDGTTILGNGTTSAIRLNLNNANTFLATQTLPTTDAQGAALIGSVNSATAATVNAARIGNGLTDAQVSDNLTIVGGSVNSSPIGQAVGGAAAGSFTTLSSTGATDLNITGAAATTIGNSGATTNLNSATINAPAVPASTDPVTATGTNVIIKGATGGRLETVTPQALVAAGVQADNGLSIGAAATPNAGKVILGGSLNKNTTVTTATTNGNLTIDGTGGVSVTADNGFSVTKGATIGNSTPGGTGLTVNNGSQLNGNVIVGTTGTNANLTVNGNTSTKDLSATGASSLTGATTDITSAATNLSGTVTTIGGTGNGAGKTTNLNAAAVNAPNLPTATTLNTTTEKFVVSNGTAGTLETRPLSSLASGLAGNGLNATDQPGKISLGGTVTQPVTLTFPTGTTTIPLTINNNLNPVQFTGFGPVSAGGQFSSASLLVGAGGAVIGGITKLTTLEVSASTTLSGATRINDLLTGTTSDDILTITNTGGPLPVNVVTRRPLSSVVTANNGLNVNPSASGNVQLGGTLIKNTDVSSGTGTGTTFTLSTSGDNALQVNNTGGLAVSNAATVGKGATIGNSTSGGTGLTVNQGAVINNGTTLNNLNAGTTSDDILTITTGTGGNVVTRRTLNTLITANNGVSANNGNVQLGGTPLIQPTTINTGVASVGAGAQTLTISGDNALQVTNTGGLTVTNQVQAGSANVTNNTTTGSLNAGTSALGNTTIGSAGTGNTRTLTVSGLTATNGIANTGDVATGTLHASGLSTTTGITNTGAIGNTGNITNTGIFDNTGAVNLKTLGTPANAATKVLGIEPVSGNVSAINANDLVTTNNGISKASNGDIELGGKPLVHATEIDKAGNNLTLTGGGNVGIGTNAPGTFTPTNTLEVQNAAVGSNVTTGEQGQALNVLAATAAGSTNARAIGARGRVEVVNGSTVDQVRGVSGSANIRGAVTGTATGAYFNGNLRTNGTLPAGFSLTGVSADAQVADAANSATASNNLIGGRFGANADFGTSPTTVARTIGAFGGAATSTTSNIGVIGAANTTNLPTLPANLNAGVAAVNTATGTNDRAIYSSGAVQLTSLGTVAADKILGIKSSTGDVSVISANSLVTTANGIDKATNGDIILGGTALDRNTNLQTDGTNGYNLNVTGTGALNVAATNGLNVTNTTTTKDLHATGNADVDGTLNADGATTLNSTLAVVGNNATTLGGTLTVAGTTQANGNVTIGTVGGPANTLTVSGASTTTGITNTGAIINTGNITNTGDLSSTGNTTLNVNAGKALKAVGIPTTTANNSILVVEGDGSGSSGNSGTVSRRDINSLITATNGITANNGQVKLGTNALTENTNLTTTGGTSNFNLNVDGTGALNVSATNGLNVTNTTTTKDFHATGNADVDGTLNADGATTLNSTLAVVGNNATTLGGTLTVAGTTQANGNVTIGTVGGPANTLTVSGLSTTTGITNTGAIGNTGNITNTGIFDNTGAVNLKTLGAPANAATKVLGIEPVSGNVSAINANDLVTTNNGISKASNGDIELGGKPLVHATEIDKAGNNLTLTGGGNVGIGTNAPGTFTPTNTLEVQNAAVGSNVTTGEQGQALNVLAATAAGSTNARAIGARGRVEVVNGSTVDQVRGVSGSANIRGAVTGTATGAYFNGNLRTNGTLPAGFSLTGVSADAQVADAANSATASNNLIGGRFGANADFGTSPTTVARTIGAFGGAATSTTSNIGVIGAANTTNLPTLPANLNAGVAAVNTATGTNDRAIYSSGAVQLTSLGTVAADKILGIKSSTGDVSVISANSLVTTANGIDKATNGDIILGGTALDRNTNLQTDGTNGYNLNVTGTGALNVAATNGLNVTNTTTTKDLHATGNADVDGTLNADGATTLNSTLAVVGNNATTLGGTLTVAGTTQANGNVTIGTVGGPANTLTVSGASTTTGITNTGAIINTGNITNTGDLSSTGNTTLNVNAGKALKAVGIPTTTANNSILVVEGDGSGSSGNSGTVSRRDINSLITATNGITANNGQVKLGTNALTENTNLTTTGGTSNFNLNVDGTGALNVSATNGLNVTNKTTTGTLQSNGISDLKGNTTIGTTAIGGNANLTVNGNATVTGTSDLNGAATIGTSTTASSLTVYGTESVSGNVTLSGTTTTIGDATVANNSGKTTQLNAPTINIPNLPTSTSSSDFLLNVTNSAGGSQVKKVDPATIIGVLTASNGVVRVGNDFRLGGSLTPGTTTISTGASPSSANLAFVGDGNLSSSNLSSGSFSTTTAAVNNSLTVAAGGTSSLAQATAANLTVSSSGSLNVVGGGLSTTTIGNLQTGASTDDFVTAASGSGVLRRTSASTIAPAFAPTLAGNGLNSADVTGKINLGNTLTTTATIKAGTTANAMDLILDANSKADGVQLDNLAAGAPSASSELVSVDPVSGNLSHVTKNLAVSVYSTSTTIASTDEAAFLNPTAAGTTITLPALVQGKRLVITNVSNFPVNVSGALYDGATQVTSILAGGKYVVVGMPTGLPQVAYYVISDQ